MIDSTESLEVSQEDESGPRPKAAPIESRFLFVDVAALRAKQLRRGARPRLGDDDTPVDVNRPQPRKAERVAMEEVKRGLILYDVPQPAKPPV
jgi:DNA-directed RNA polymerase subunit K/omega